jgi:RHS repeat-associated protein
LNGEILAETDGSGNTTAEYVFFAGKRVAMLQAGGSAQFYVEDMLGTSRVVTTNTGVVCYDADFYPYGGERTPYTNSCSATNNYKFEGKERDTETLNDDFGARYYSNRFGRWLSADWSAVPVPVPYANLTNPQTLNLYSMVADDPESFADLDGHCGHLVLPGAPAEPCSHPPNLHADVGEGFDYGNAGIAGAECALASCTSADEVSAQTSQIAAQQQAAQNAISFTIQLQNVEGTPNPQEPVTLGSGTVFSFTITYKQDLPPGTSVTLDIVLTDSKGKKVPGSYVFYSIEPHEQVGNKVGAEIGTSKERGIPNELVVKGLVFGKNGELKPNKSASLRVGLTDKAVHREGTRAISAKLTGGREQIDRAQAATLWSGPREFVVP